MPRFKKILCPVDFDPNSLQTLRLASEISQAYSATLHVLHVLDVATAPKPEVGIPFEAAATDRLERLALRKIDRKVRRVLHVEAGDPGVEVLDAAKQLDADLIVIATHGRKGLRRLVLGSVAERIVREARCPVITLRPKGGRVRVSRTRARRKT